jgi:3-keto-disaccharide hydrolase
MARLLISLILAIPLFAGPEVVGFDGAKPGDLPPGWTVAMTHLGGAPRWEVVRDESAPHPPYVLAQVSTDSTAGRFPLAIWDRATVRNGEVKVAFRVIGGQVDQAAGVVWRFRDADNYYIARANALEKNVVLYKVENGVRLSIAPKGLPSRSYGVKHEIPRDRWNTLRVTFQEQTFTVFLNGARLFDAEDGTFPGAGKTGLWTKADSVTYFDDFTVVSKEAKR